MARLKAYYRENVVPALNEKFGYENKMQVPRLMKIVVNMGVGEGARTESFITAGAGSSAPIRSRARSA